MFPEHQYQNGLHILYIVSQKTAVQKDVYVFCNC